jgi:hypothetical protein
LWVRGDFDPQTFLAASPWTADAVWTHGERHLKRVMKDSGFSILVSAAEFDDFAGQIRDAVAFFQNHAAELNRLRTLPDGTHRSLNFGLAQRDRYAWSVELPAELVEVVGPHRVGIELSLYAISDADRGS